MRGGAHSDMSDNERRMRASKLSQGESDGEFFSSSKKMGGMFDGNFNNNNGGRHSDPNLLDPRNINRGGKRMRGSRGH